MTLIPQHLDSFKQSTNVNTFPHIFIQSSSPHPRLSKPSSLPHTIETLSFSSNPLHPLDTQTHLATQSIFPFFLSTHIYRLVVSHSHPDSSKHKFLPKDLICTMWLPFWHQNSGIKMFPPAFCLSPLSQITVKHSNF